MKKHQSMDKDYDLWVLLHQARDTIFNTREKELSQYFVTTIQAAVLFIIQEIGGKTTPSEISRWMIREPHTISSILTRMEKDGLVKKTRNPDKRSEIIVNLTKKGYQAYSQSMKRESIHKIMSCLSREEHQQLQSSLKKLRDKALETSNERGKAPFP